MKKILFFVLLALAGVVQAQAQVAVVVNKAVSVDAVDANTLQDIYTLDKSKWDDGTRVVPVNLKGKEDTAFGYFSRGLSDLKKVWMRKKLAGEGQPPESLASDADVIAKVAATPGAIGYVNAGAVTDAVKVVATIN